MTIGQADPHPSQVTQIELSGNRIQNNKQIIRVESMDMPEKFYSVDQGHQKKILDSDSANFLRINNKKGEIQTSIIENIRVNRNNKINELPISPKHKMFSQINKESDIIKRSMNSREGLRVKLKTIQKEI